MKKLDYDYCHAAPVLEWMSQKWALVAMMIEGEGLVERTSYESIPPCVEYSLTPLAQNFLREHTLWLPHTVLPRFPDTIGFPGIM